MTRSKHAVATSLGCEIRLCSDPAPPEKIESKPGSCKFMIVDQFAWPTKIEEKKPNELMVHVMNDSDVERPLTELVKCNNKFDEVDIWALIPKYIREHHNLIQSCLANFVNAQNCHHRLSWAAESLSFKDQKTCQNERSSFLRERKIKPAADDEIKNFLANKMIKKWHSVSTQWDGVRLLDEYELSGCKGLDRKKLIEAIAQIPGVQTIIEDHQTSCRLIFLQSVYTFVPVQALIYCKSYKAAHSSTDSSGDGKTGDAKLRGTG